MTVKSEKQLASYESMGSLLLTIRSLLCTTCILACTVTAAPSQAESQSQLYKAYLHSLSKGDAVPAVPNLSDTKASVMDKTTFEQALKAGMPDIFPKFWILFICVLNKLVSTTHSVL